MPKILIILVLVFLIIEFKELSFIKMIILKGKYINNKMTAILALNATIIVDNIINIKSRFNKTKFVFFLRIKISKYPNIQARSIMLKLSKPF